MTKISINRRTLLATGLTLASGLIVPARAQGLAPTPSMRGGSNNYRPGAPIVERIGGGGFLMTGTVRRAGDGKPLEGQRIQIAYDSDEFETVFLRPIMSSASDTTLHADFVLKPA